MMGNCKSDTGGTNSKKNNGNRKVTLALFGLDNAGKTVTAKGFLPGEVETPTPTIGFSNVDFRHGSHDITMFDLGGGQNIRGIWKNYFAEIHGAIFVVDASAPKRLDECKKALADVVKDEMIQGKPLLLLANKQDVSGALDEMDICDHLQLEDLVNTHKIPCRVESCSAALRMNQKKNQKMDKSINDGFCWLLELVDEKWNELNERVKRDIERKMERERRERVERAERVRRSRELREKEEKANGHVSGRAAEDREEDRDAGSTPFKPIKHQLDMSQKKNEERKRSREQEETRQHGVGGRVSSYPETKSTQNVSWKPPARSKHSSDHDDDSTNRPSTRSNHRSDSEEEDVRRSRSNERLDLYNEVDHRPSARSRSGLDREISSTRSKHGSDDDENNDLGPKSSSNHRTDFDEEIQRLRNYNAPLKPITPTRITGRQNGSDASITDADDDRSLTVYPSWTPKSRILMPPVPLLRATEAEGHRRWNGHSTAGNMALNNDKKKKKARFNQTAPALDSPEPHSSWRNTYSASPNGDLFHSSSTYPAQAEVRMSKTPLLQRLVQAKAAEESNSKRRTKLNDDEDEDDDDDVEDRPRTNTRDTFMNRRPTSSAHAMRRPNSHNYNYNDMSDDDDDDDIVV